jgi:hypothetical protein
MTINTKVRQHQQRQLQEYAKNSNAYSFFNQLTSPELLATTESLLPEYRERLYPPTETLSMFLAQALNEDRSCQKAVNDAAVTRMIGGLPSVSTNTGGYCQARQRLPLTMLSEMVRTTGELINNRLSKKWLWRGRRVRLIDGTTLTLPDTEANQERYPQQSNQKPGLGFPICRLVGIICLSSGAILNASMGRYQGKGSSEQALLRDILDTFESGDVVLGDAFYGTYFLLASLLDRGIDGVFEQMGVRKRVTDFRKGKQLGTKDHVITLNKPGKCPDWMSEEDYTAFPESLNIRELSVGGKILITTLLSPKEISKPVLKALYKRRWEIEVDFRSLKTTMGMETLSCKTPEMNEKEMWVYFLAYNLIRLLMCQSAFLADLLPRQISFKHTLQLWLAWNQRGACDYPEIEGQLFVLIAQQRVGNRPGRIEPRVVKRRPKAYSLLRESRAKAREKIRKNGHPKKLK